MSNISVAICTYNGEKYIEEQINSILKQSVLPSEIIVCDDLSTDNTVKKISEIKSSSIIPIKIFINEVNLGYRKNFEKCIGLCSGELIFLCDQDDFWAVDKVKIIEEEFRTNNNLQLVFTNAQLVDGNSVVLKNDLWKNIKFDYKSFPDSKLERIQSLCGRSIATGATMAIRKDLYNQAYPFSNNFVQDEWLIWTAILKDFEIKFLNNKLTFYRQHTDNQIGAKKSTIKQILNQERDISKKIKENKELLNFIETNLMNISTDYFLKREEILRIRGTLFKNRMFRVFQLIYFLLTKKNITLNEYKLYFDGYRTFLQDILKK